LYHDGSESMAYHSDDEPMLAKNGAIASMSFGAERRFLFRHNRYKENQIPVVELILNHGSLLLMQGKIQKPLRIKQEGDHTMPDITHKIPIQIKCRLDTGVVKRSGR